MSKTTTAIVDSRWKTALWYFSYVEFYRSTSEQIADFQRFAQMCFFYFRLLLNQFIVSLRYKYQSTAKPFEQYHKRAFDIQMKDFSTG